MAKGSLVVVGTGIAVGQLSMEVRSWICNAGKVLYCVADAATERLLLNLILLLSRCMCFMEKVNRDGKLTRRWSNGLWSVCGRLRCVRGLLRSPRDICGSFDKAIALARAEGFPAQMLPAVSSLDCLFCDLGVDPATGCQIYEATDLLLRRRPIDVHSHTIIWQIAATGDLGFSYKGYTGKNLSVLLRYLLIHYSGDQEATIYEAAQYPVLRSRHHQNQAQRASGAEDHGNLHAVYSSGGSASCVPLNASPLRAEFHPRWKEARADSHPAMIAWDRSQGRCTPEWETKDDEPLDLGSLLHTHSVAVTPASKEPVKCSLEPFSRVYISEMLRYLRDPEVIRFIGKWSAAHESDIASWLCRGGEARNLFSIIVDQQVESAAPLAERKRSFLGITSLRLLDLRAGMAVSGTIVGDKDWWGRGIGFSANVHKLNFAFKVLKLTCVHAATDRHNDRSKRMLCRLGYRRSAGPPGPQPHSGPYQDREWYCLSREQWFRNEIQTP